MFDGGKRRLSVITVGNRPRLGRTIQVEQMFAMTGASEQQVAEGMHPFIIELSLLQSVASTAFGYRRLLTI